MKILILAGGQGTRLWPISTRECPKQFIHFGDHESLLKKTVRRFVRQGLSKDIYVVTNKEYVERTLEEIREFDPEFQHRILIEPYSKNTAPAIAWSIRMLLLNHNVPEEELIITVPIDHIFSDEEAFIQQTLDAIAEIELGQILALSAECATPITGYGYIKKGIQLSEYTYRAEQFIEKPIEKVAKELLKEGGWLWNVGIYVFSIRTYLEALRLHHQALYAIVTDQEYNDRVYEYLLPVSIDDAVIVHAQNLKIRVLVDINWIDIGSWENLSKFLTHEQYQRLYQIINSVFLVKSQNKSVDKETVDLAQLATAGTQAIFHGS